MERPLGKMTPTAIVAVVVGYCCWSHWEGPAPASEVRGGGQAPEVMAALLAPSPAPDPERDPFKPTGEAMPPSPAPGKSDLAAGATGAAAPPAARTMAAPTLTGLVLNATLVRGKRRVAMINGRFYAEGETLKDANNKGTSSTVVQVQPDRVLLRQQEQTLELRYPDRESKSRPAPTPPGGSRAASGQAGTQRAVPPPRVR